MRDLSVAQLRNVFARPSMLHAGRRSLAIRSFIAERTCVACAPRPPFLPSKKHSLFPTASAAASARHVPRTSFACHASTTAKSEKKTAGSSSGSMKNLDKEVDYGAKLRQQKQADMLDCLADESAGPNRVWAQYVELLDMTKDGPVPLSLHQRVLRRCTPPFQILRTAFVRSLPRPLPEARPHAFEHRFLTIFNTLKRSGLRAELEDYEFVLEQFAAVGHHIGCARVLREVVLKGLEPRTRTYGLCLRAIAYRLSLPQSGSELEVARLKEECSRLCLFVVKMVQKRVTERRAKAKGKENAQKGRTVEEVGENGLPSVCVDLTLRIMKDTDDSETFLSLLKLAYGIDLEYLDRRPLSLEGVLEQPQHLSTAALTTLVDFFGRTSQLSKMVATFEVLKAPLSIPLESPKDGGENGMEGRDEDDEDDYVLPMSTLAKPLPSASPNITTYNTLIRQCTARRHKDFAKHYVLEALELDRISSEKLQTQLGSLFAESKISAVPIRREELGSEGVQAGNVRANVDTFRPLFGLANRDKDYALMKWVLMRLREAYRWKTAEQRFFERLVGVESDAAGGASVSNGVEELADLEETESARRRDGWEAAEGLSDPSEFFTPSSSSSSISSSSSSSSPSPSPSTPTSEASSSPSLSESSRPFDPFQHVSLLRTTRGALNALSGRIGTSLARIADRNKERLGRRVWEGKRVYMRDRRHRVLLSKEEWLERVRFGGEREGGRQREGVR